MTPQFIDTILFAWGFQAGLSDLMFTTDGACPMYRVGVRGLPGHEPLTVFTALRWPG